MSRVWGRRGPGLDVIAGCGGGGGPDVGLGRGGTSARETSINRGFVTTSRRGFGRGHELGSGHRRPLPQPVTQPDILFRLLSPSKTKVAPPPVRLFCQTRLSQLADASLVRGKTAVVIILNHHDYINLYSSKIIALNNENEYNRRRIQET